MEQSYEKKYHELEKKHWWFKTRREVILGQLRSVPKDAKVLDVGCSGGLLLENLRDMGFFPENLYGIDISEEGIQIARQKGFDHVSVMDGSDLSFEPHTFDVIISSDSLEHMEYDQRALSQWYECLKDGGKLIVFVPAYMFLWSAHDEVNHHFRRYTKTSLAGKVEAAGFQVLKKGYWNSFLFPPIALVRILKSLIPGSDQNSSDDLEEMSPVLNKTLRSILRIENNLIEQNISFPFGVSTFCIAKKE